MPLIEIQVQEVLLEFIMFIKEDGLKKLQEMMSMSFIINIENKKVSKKINQEENYDDFIKSKYFSFIYHIIHKYIVAILYNK
jgi:hypothetical protein